MNDINKRIEKELTKLSVNELGELTTDQCMSLLLNIFKKESVKEKVFMDTFSEGLRIISAMMFDSCDIEETDNKKTLYTGDSKTLVITFEIEKDP